MRLVEVVMLMGAHCVSPVEHTQMTTDAAKVQCAVVIEKDTDTGAMTVTPGAAAKDPQVVAAAERFRAAPSDPLTAAGTKIVPAWAPAGSPTVEIKPPVVNPAGRPGASMAAPAVSPPPATSPSTEQASAQEASGDGAAADDTPEVAAAPAASDVNTPDIPPAKPVPVKKVATLMPPEQKRSPAKAAAAKRQPAAAAAVAGKASSQCMGTAVAQWYTAADGHRRYRCTTASQPASPRTSHQLY